MTHRQLLDWTNQQLHAGTLGFEDASKLVLATGRMPVAPMPANAAPPADETVDFTALVRDGIAGARSRHDASAVDRLQQTLAIMTARQAFPRTDATATADSSVKFREALAAFARAST